MTETGPGIRRKEREVGRRGRSHIHICPSCFAREADKLFRPCFGTLSGYQCPVSVRQSFYCYIMNPRMENNSKGMPLLIRKKFTLCCCFTAWHTVLVLCELPNKLSRVLNKGRESTLVMMLNVPGAFVTHINEMQS